MIHRIFASALAACAMLAIAGAGDTAWAHPHVWVTVKSELVYAPDGSVTGVRHAWTFDDMFSVFATQGIEAKKKGEFTREELAPLAEVNVTSLKEYDFFTQGLADGKKVEFSEPPAGYYLDFDPKDTVLTLHFTLPLKAPLKAKDFSRRSLRPRVLRRFQLRGEGARPSSSARRRNASSVVGSAAGDERRAVAAAEPARSQPAGSIADHRRRVRQQDLGEMPMKVVAGVTPRLAKLLVVVRSSCWWPAWSMRAGARRTVRRAASAKAPPPAAGGVLGWMFAKQAEFYRQLSGADPRRQGRRQRGLEPVRHLVSLRHVSCRRARSRQGGDLVLPGGQ